jgi:hypothetical protein
VENNKSNYNNVMVGKSKQSTIILAPEPLAITQRIITNYVRKEIKLTACHRNSEKKIPSIFPLLYPKS